MIVYKLTNTLNQKSYIGMTTQSSEKRLRQHVCASKKDDLKNSLIARAIKKYGVKNFALEEISKALDIEDLRKKEFLAIKDYNTLSPNGYNLKEGGQIGGNGGSNKGIKWSETARKRHSQTMKNRNLEAWNKGLKGVLKPNKGSFTKEKVTGEKNPFYGKSHGAETIKKLSKANDLIKRKIVCLETGEIFDSIKAATVKMNLDLGNLYKVLVKKNKTIKGYSFEYFNKEESK